MENVSEAATALRPLRSGEPGVVTYLLHVWVITGLQRRNVKDLVLNDSHNRPPWTKRAMKKLPRISPRSSVLFIPQMREARSTRDRASGVQTETH